MKAAPALYQRQAVRFCKSPRIDTAEVHWQEVPADLAMLTSRNTDDAARFSRFMEELYRCFDLAESRQMAAAEICEEMGIGKTTYYRYWFKVKSAPW